MGDLKVYFATDIHGSDRCFRKFINAARFYEVDVLIMGGDITGKMLVPIVPTEDGRYQATVFGQRRQVDEAGLPALKKVIADAGYYPYEATAEEVAALGEDAKAVDRLFDQVIRRTLESWLTLASERLKGTGTRVFLSPGNDDPPFVGPLLAQADFVENPERERVELPGRFEMISVGYSNITPWRSPRELPEDRLGSMIATEAERVASLDRTIFNLHVPPLRSRLDQAILVDEEMRPRMRGGMPVQDGVGSSAVREAIEHYQPMLSLHGHIHESAGAVKIGPTVAINPGSEYSEGILRGVLVTLSDRKKVKGYQLVSG
jgi:Icc-related predicted phosphoesterase